MSGNIPVSKQRLINLEIQKGKKILKRFNIKTGMLMGPVALFAFKASIIFSTSRGKVGKRKNTQNV